MEMINISKDIQSLSDLDLYCGKKRKCIEGLIDDEQKNNVIDLNNISKDTSRSLLHELVVKQGRLNSGKTAIIDKDNLWTYKELICHSFGVSNALKAAGCLEGSLVAINIPESTYVAAAIIGVLIAGCCYVPIDVSQEQIINKKILEDNNIKYILTLDENVSLISNNIEVINIRDKKDEKVNLNQVFNENTESAACSIITSSCTGSLKRIVMSHAKAATIINNLNEKMSITRQDNILALANLSSVISIYDLFGILSKGGTIIYPDEEMIEDPAYWIGLLIRYDVSIWNTEYNMMQRVINYLETDNVGYKIWLRKILLSGSSLPLSLIKQVHEFLPKAELFNLKGMIN